MVTKPLSTNCDLKKNKATSKNALEAILNSCGGTSYVRVRKSTRA